MPRNWRGQSYDPPHISPISEGRKLNTPQLARLKSVRDRRSVSGFLGPREIKVPRNWRGRDRARPAHFPGFLGFVSKWGGGSWGWGVEMLHKNLPTPPGGVARVLFP